MAKTKAQLRSEIRAQPRGSAPEVAERDGRILDHLRAWPPLRRAGRIGVFLPLPYEPDLRPLLRELRGEGKVLAVPARRVDGDWYWAELERIEETDIAGRNPPAVDPVAFEVILVPCRAVDPAGNRLGHGRGIYDRLLRGLPATTLGVVYHRQVVGTIPAEDHDVRLGGHVDERGVHPAGGRCPQ